MANYDSQVANRWKIHICVFSSSSPGQKMEKAVSLKGLGFSCKSAKKNKRKRKLRILASDKESEDRKRWIV